MSAARALALAPLALAALCGCGVQAQDGPERLPPELLPPELRSSAEPTAGRPLTPVTTTVPVHLVEDGRPVPQQQPAQAHSVERALVRLMAAADGQGRRRSSVPPGTVAGPPAVRRVDVRVEGRRLDLPVERGAVSAGPVAREDHRCVGPARGAVAGPLTAP